MVLEYVTYEHGEHFVTMRALAEKLNRFGVMITDEKGSHAIEHIDVATMIATGVMPPMTTFWERNGAVIAERRAHPGSGGCGGSCS